MKRVFELSAHVNSSGYGVTLKINGRPFAAAAVRKNGDTVDSAYKQLCSELHEVYGDKWEYFDIVDARAYVLHLLCLLSGITKLEGTE